VRRQQLSEAQITALLDPPTDQRELVRHYTLSAADLGAIRRCRGDHNRLGHALMLCYLRYPGRPLKAGERPPRPLLLFIAEQIDAPSVPFLKWSYKKRCTNAIVGVPIGGSWLWRVKGSSWLRKRLRN